jgi:hypothetical protein
MLLFGVTSIVIRDQYNSARRTVPCRRIDDRFMALQTLFEHLCTAPHAKHLPLVKVAKIATTWAKPIPVTQNRPVSETVRQLCAVGRERKVQ